jgi:hypothetical protein
MRTETGFGRSGVRPGSTRGRPRFGAFGCGTSQE